MEEDLKEESIESITKILEQHLKNSEAMFEKFGTLAIEYADIKRISKILTRNKELEEIEENHRKENGKLRERVKELEEENSSIKYLNEGLRLDKNILTDMVNDLQEQKRNSIPISVIQNKIDELTKYRDIAKELIEHRVVIADSDSLNYGRAEAHDKDIQVLQELLEKRK